MSQDMGNRLQSGFTIIEVTLFLAVTGILILMVIGGTGASLNAQRYRDATESLKNVLQKQYADLSNVQNDRDNNWSCNSSAVTTEGGASTSQRGQSNCLLVGKYVRIQNSDLSVYRVLAREKSSNEINDIDAMVKDYVFSVSTTEFEDGKLEWGTRIAWAAAGSPVDAQVPTTPRSIGILVVRSPYSGQIFTFTSNSVPAKNAITAVTLSNMIKAGGGIPGQAERLICLDTNGLFMNTDMGISIASYAGSATAIKLHANGNATEGELRC